MGAPGKAMMPDGQDSRAYDYTKGCSHGGWAWEFLRRDRDFRSVMGVFSKHVTAKAIAPNVMLYRIKQEAPSLRDWGLIFRRITV
jgi:hypothetical protein